MSDNGPGERLTGRSQITAEQVIERARRLGCDPSEWSNEHLQMLVDLYNEPMRFPTIELKKRPDDYEALYIRACVDLLVNVRGHLPIITV